jgi:hypothetical protein
VYKTIMSLMELKEQVAALPPEEQAELATYLVQRLRRDDPNYRAELTEIIDDRDSKNWARWSDVKRTGGG